MKGYLGADTGTATARRVQELRQGRADTRATRANTADQLAKTEDFRKGAESRAAKRKAGTMEAEEYISEKAVFNRSVTTQAKSLQAEEFLSETAQSFRKLKGTATSLEGGVNVLQYATPENWQQVRKELGPLSRKLGMPEEYNSSWIDQVTKASVQSVDYLRGVGLEKFKASQKSQWNHSSKIATGISDGKHYATAEGPGRTTWVFDSDGIPALHDPDKYTLADISSEFKNTPKTTSNLQQDIVDGMRMLSKLEGVGADFAEDYLTWGGKLGAITGEKLDKAGVVGRNINDLYKWAWGGLTSIAEASGANTAIEKATGRKSLFEMSKPDLIAFSADKKNFTYQLDQFFNDYRRSITGAAAAFAEIQDLKRSSLNSDLSPSQFVKMYHSTVNSLTKKMEDTARDLNNGVRWVNDWKYDPKTGESILIGSTPVTYNGGKISLEQGASEEWSQKTLDNGVKYESE